MLSDDPAAERPSHHSCSKLRRSALRHQPLPAPYLGLAVCASFMGLISIISRLGIFPTSAIPLPQRANAELPRPAERVSTEDLQEGTLPSSPPLSPGLPLPPLPPSSSSPPSRPSPSRSLLRPVSGHPPHKHSAKCSEPPALSRLRLEPASNYNSCRVAAHCSLLYKCRGVTKIFRYSTAAAALEPSAFAPSSSSPPGVPSSSHPPLLSGLYRPQLLTAASLLRRLRPSRLPCQAASRQDSNNAYDALLHYLLTPAQDDLFCCLG